MIESPPLSVGTLAQIACIWEATARKPGNVHRYQDFADTTYLDFLLSAAAVASVLDLAPQRRIGDTVLAGVHATRRVVARNTNLGILLLLAPLAAVPPDTELRLGLEQVLSQLDVMDSQAVFAAIRLAHPGGLGAAPDQDVHAEPTLPLRDIMALAAERDLIARQYQNGFREIFEVAVPALRTQLGDASPEAGTLRNSLETAIIHCHLHLLAHFPDSLIARKRGGAEAEEASRRARQVLAAGWPTQADAVSLLTEWDVWLRAEGNARNPGTTADLVTATLFVALRDRLVSPDRYSGHGFTQGATGENR